jgi:hypothetical protein
VRGAGVQCVRSGGLTVSVRDTIFNQAAPLTTERLWSRQRSISSATQFRRKVRGTKAVLKSASDFRNCAGLIRQILEILVVLLRGRNDCTCSVSTYCAPNVGR